MLKPSTSKGREEQGTKHKRRADGKEKSEEWGDSRPERYGGLRENRSKTFTVDKQVSG